MISSKKHFYTRKIIILWLTFNAGLALTGFRTTRLSGPFLEGPENFAYPESHIKISNLMITELFYSHILNMNTEVPFIQEVSVIYTSPFLDTDEPKMTLRTRKVSETFGKRAPGRNGQMGPSLLEWTCPTEKSGPPRKAGWFFRNFSGWAEPIHLVSHQTFWKFWLNGSCPQCVKRTLVTRYVFDSFDMFLTAFCQLSVGPLDRLANQNRNNGN